jgi:hypothetical protein
MRAGTARRTAGNARTAPAIPACAHRGALGLLRACLRVRSRHLPPYPNALDTSSEGSTLEWLRVGGFGRPQGSGGAQPSPPPQLGLRERVRVRVRDWALPHLYGAQSSAQQSIVADEVGR